MNNKKIYTQFLPGIIFFILMAGGVYSFITLSAMKEFRFNHKLHAKISEIDCKSCHENGNDGMMTYPNHETCSMCHDEVEKKDSCKYCHLSNTKMKVFPVRKIFAQVSFDHKTHENKGVDCLICHQDMNKRVGLHEHESLPPMQLCESCHNKGNLKSKNCDFCHPEGYASKKPLSHSPLWNRQHGSGIHSDEDSRNCRYCHNGTIQTDCLSCHKTQAPESHTISFIKKRHGQISMLERQKCSTCHEQQTCLECHKNTPPMSHTAMYGSPYNRHCNNCHLSGNAAAVSGTSSNCYFCHIPAMTNTLHLAKATLPAGHLTSNCLGCHRYGGTTNAPAVKHPAYGTDSNCLQCHH